MREALPLVAPFLVCYIISLVFDMMIEYMENSGQIKENTL